MGEMSLFTAGVRNADIVAMTDGVLAGLYFVPAYFISLC